MHDKDDQSPSFSKLPVNFIILGRQKNIYYFNKGAGCFKRHLLKVGLLYL